MATPAPTNSAHVQVLEARLTQLASEWYSTTQPDRHAAIAQRYSTVMDELYQLGWDEVLDLESELPAAFMPTVYQERHPQRATWSESPLSTLLSRSSHS